ncbi:MAG: class I SAM-dependent methyltransferase, partial [Acidobacteriota bacterium]
LELTEPQRGWFAPFGRAYIRRVVPALGGVLSGSREYRYLAQSIASFPAPELFAQQMRRAGLDVLEVRALSLGACHLFVGSPRGSA